MENARTQNIAILLIVMAAVCIAVGEKFNWIHLVDFANMFGGGGVGILTGQKLASISNKDGGQINVNPTVNQ
jgi:uncharacterized membrane protein AbrB (regulator of aidB expression)